MLSIMDSSNKTIKKEVLNSLIKVYNQVEKRIYEGGLRYNIFSILKMDTKEVLLHTPIIHSLLDKNGQHGAGSGFCELFLETLRAETNQKITFNCSDYIVIKDMSLGEIDDNYQKGGSLDLYLEDNKGNALIIENKIHAVDQNNQLIRYKKYNPKATLLYLTLNGTSPSHASVGNKLLLNEDYYCISYRDTISNWVQKCANSVKSTSLVYSTLFQYQMIIDQLTQQNNYNFIYMTIRDQMLKNKELFLMASEIKSTYDILKNEIVEELRTKVVSNTKNNRLLYSMQANLSLWLETEADDTALYISFVLRNDNNEAAHNTNLAKQLKVLISEALEKEENPDPRYLYSIYLNDIKVQNLDNQQLLELLDTEQLNKKILTYNKIIQGKAKRVEQLIKKNALDLIL